MLQAPEFAINSSLGNTTYDYERNGLIGADVLDVGIENAKTPAYTYAVNANKQIAAVDEVLMKADNKGVIATGGYAKSETTGATVSANIATTDTEYLKDVAATDSTYGALVGCFDYKGSETYYVVNYNVTKGTTQQITLNFNKEFNYRMIDADGTENSKGDLCTMTIPAGEAVLVVLDSEVVYQAPVEIYPADFGITDGTYKNLKADIRIGTYAPIVKGEAAKTLDGTVLSANVTINGTGRICYGGTHSGGTYGINLSKDTREGYGNGLFLSTVGVSPSKLIPLRPSDFNTDTLVGKAFDLKISTELVNHNGTGTLDLKLGIYINGNLYKNDFLYWDDYEASLGTYLGIYTEAEGDSVVVNNPSLDLSKYDAVTTTDLGMAQATYAPADITVKYPGESLDGVVFSANVDFKNTTANDIRFGGMDGYTWNTLTFTRWDDGRLVLATGNLVSLETGYTTNDTQVIAGDVTGLEHLRISVDYVDFDRDSKKDDVKLGVWLNHKLYNNQYFYYIDLAPYFGTNILFHAPVNTTETNNVKRNVFGDFTVLEAPIVKEQGEVSYNLADGSYTVPGTTTTYDKPGDYSVKYTEAGITYTGDVALYYDGDATLDGKVDSRDLIRNKKNPDTTGKKAMFEGLDVDNDGEKTEKDVQALRKILVGEKVDKDTVFGVISDIHLLGDGKDLARQKRYEAALNYYKKNGAEVIIMNADITDHGEPGAYKALVQIANEVYKDTPQAQRPQFVVTADNHEYYDAWNWSPYLGTYTWSQMQTRFYNGLNELDTEIKDGALNTSRTINGYTFIGVSADSCEAGPAGYSSSTLTWLKNALEEAAQANPDKPIFVAIHQPVQNTVSSSDGADGVEAYESIVGKYPQVVLFTSHTHSPLADEHSIWQGPTSLSTFKGTVVNTGGVHDVGGLGRTGQGDKVTFANVDKNVTTSEVYTYGNILLVRATTITIIAVDAYQSKSSSISYTVQ